MKALIVDDEANVREGIKAIIDWEACGFSICGEGINGNDGLEKILALKPELTLLDIKMPALNGIEVAERARKAGYAGKFIILSGYSEFAYAQSAIRQGVSAYLLKPIDENELADVVRRAAADIERELEKAESDREGLMRGALLGGAALEVPDAYKDCRHFQAAVLDRGKAGPGAEPGEPALTLRFARENGLDCTDVDGRSALILCGSDCAARFLRFARSADAELARDRAVVCFGRAVQSYGDLAASYRDALSLAKRRFFIYDGCPVLCGHPAEAGARELPAGKKSVKIDESLDMLYLCIEVGELDRIAELLDGIRMFYRESAIRRDKVVGILTNLYCEIMRRIREHHIHLEESFRSYSEIHDKLDGMAALNDIVAWLRGEFYRYSAAIGNDSGEDIIMKLLNYIEKYSDIDMSLESLASVFGYNSTYLGRAFKNAVGESFLTFLDKARIKKAEALLEQSNLKIYEIAAKVGYMKLDNFFIKFKKYNGVSPNEYRKTKCLTQGGDA
jgi:two-component system response regulator YesN